jgi:hypothetical protein
MTKIFLIHFIKTSWPSMVNWIKACFPLGRYEIRSSQDMKGTISIITMHRCRYSLPFSMLGKNTVLGGKCFMIGIRQGG